MRAPQLQDGVGEPAATTPAVETSQLSLALGRRAVLQQISMTVPAGSAYLLAGPNGAGKTSLLGVLLNGVHGAAGDVRIFGEDVRRQGPDRRARIGYVPETAHLRHGALTAKDWLAYVAAYRPTWDPAYAARLTNALDIPLGERLAHLSKGQIRRIQLLSALAHRPPLLLLDEPMDGLDPVARHDVLGLLADCLAETGATLLLATHTISEVERLVDHVGVLKAGRLIAQLPTSSLGNRLRVYTADGPEGWSETVRMDGVLRREVFGRQTRWTIWGDQSGVRRALDAAGGIVRDDHSPPLADAVVALLRQDLLG